MKRAALISYSAILFNIVAGILYTPWLVSQIGRNDYGLYILVTSFLAYFVVDYGMFQSINKLVSEYRANGDQDKIEKTIGVATKIYLIWDVLIGIVLFSMYFFVDTIFGNLPTEELSKFKTVFIIASIFSVLNFPFGFVRGVMYAYEYMVENRLMELGTKILVILSTIAVLLLGGGLYWLVLVYAFVPFIKNIVSVIFLYRKGVRMNIKYWSRSTVNSILGISAWLFVYVLSELFINNISPTIITVKSSLEQVAVFAIGFTLYGYAYQISNSVAGLFLPKIARMNHLNERQQLNTYAIKVSRIQLLITGFITFGIITTGSFFINAWMGADFSDSYYVASLMVIPGLIIYAQQVELAQLYIENKIYYQSIMMVFTAISSVSLSLILTPLYDAIGTAISISIANLLFMALGMSFVYSRKLNFDGKRFYGMFFKFICVFALSAGLVILVDRYILDYYFLMPNKWLRFISTGSLFTFSFCTVTYLLLLNSYEKNLLRSVVNKLSRK